MATQLFLRFTNSDWASGTEDSKLNGGTPVWVSQTLSTSRGAAASARAVASATGTTLGTEFGALSPSDTDEWYISPPLAADVTIAGTVTFNIRGAEGDMKANAGPQVVVKRIDKTGALVSTVINSEQGVEFGTAEAAHNWTGTPTSTAFLRGDRIAVVVAANDVGTMASGYTLNIWVDGPTAAASGDSYVTFTETFSFEGEPAGSQVFLTTTAAGINPGAANEYEAWTSRGAGSTNAVTNSATGWTAPIQATETGGGTALEWYTKALTAFTLGGAVRCNIRAKVSADCDATVRCEVAICDADGTNAVVWAAMSTYAGLTTSDVAYSFLISGDDTSVAAGQRLRIRVYIDDGKTTSGAGTPTGPLVTGHTVTVTYAGASGGAAGDSYLTFGQTLTQNLSAAITGTITASTTEADVVAGGKTIIITLTGDTWIAAGAGSFDLQRDEILQGLDSAQSEALGWNLQVRDLEPITSVVRTSDTVVTITLAGSALYNITAQETITVTVPGTAVNLGAPITATPTFTVSVVSTGSGRPLVNAGLVSRGLVTAGLVN